MATTAVWDGSQWRPTSVVYGDLPPSGSGLEGQLYIAPADEGGRNMWVYSKDAWYKISSPGDGVGVEDHGLLLGLDDDDHKQYHNNARGDARYSPLGHDHDDRYVEVAGDTMSGQLVNDHTDGYSIVAKGGIQSDDEVWVTDGGVTIDDGFLSVDGGNVGGAIISGGFESYHDPATMPDRAVGFWRRNGFSYQPLMAAEDHEPVTKAYLDSRAKDADKHYLHQQEAPSKVWTVLHSLGKRPSVSITDAGGAVVYGEIVYPSTDRCDLRFEFPITGTAICN